jgi:hypothetical protein
MVLMLPVLVPLGRGTRKKRRRGLRRIMAGRGDLELGPGHKQKLKPMCEKQHCNRHFNNENIRLVLFDELFPGPLQGAGSCILRG